MNEKHEVLSFKPFLWLVRTAVIMLVLASNCLTATAQTETRVHGTVKSATDGLPLIGVNVVEKGTSNGTITDINGSYTLTVPGNSELVFTYIGFANQEVKVISGKNTYDITLTEDSKALEEVVVIGYGVQKKSVVTAAISQVSGDELAKGSPTNFQNALKGKVSGVQIMSESGAPGAGSTVRIRGVGTINNSNPLYLVDGMPVDDINNINPSDIESVEVLKDAASAAIYGTRGANGVVLVTTKKGSVQKPVLTYEVSYGWQSSTKKLDYMNAAQYQMMVNEMNKNEGKELKFPNFDINNPSTYPTTETDWQDELLNNHALVYNHKVSLSGGTDRGIYYASFGYLNQNGVVASENSYYKRYNARFNNTYTVMEDKNRFWLPKVTFGSNISYSHTESMGIGNNSDVSGVLTSMALTPPNEPIYQTDPEQLKIYDQLYAGYVKDADGRAYNIINYMREMGNPLAVRDVSNNTLNTANNFNANLNLEATLLPGLKFRTNVGLAWAFWGSRGYTPEYYITTNNRNETSSVFHKKNESYKWQVENVLSYEKTIGKHAFSVLVGQSALSEESTGLTGEDYNLLRLGMEYAYLNSAAAERSLERTDDYINQHRLSSFFARATYNYAEKYMLSLVFRRDGSSNFGPNNKYASFPSISAGGNMTEEKFMKNRPGWLNLIKLRASWGRNGNESIGAFQYTSLLNMGSNNLALGKGSKDQIYVGIVSAGYANPSIQWETSEQTDLGIDLRLLNNSLSFSVDYFDKRTKDMILWLQTPKYLGYWGMNANSGTMSNKGVESEESFTIMERVRKGTVAKGKCKEWSQFKKDMLEHDVPEWYIWSCERIKYMFPKAHAAAYVMMAYRIAYCKINYPLAYYAAYFGIRASAFSYELMGQGKEKLLYHMKEYKRKAELNQLSKKDQDTLKDMKNVLEMYARGFDFLPIDIYKSKASKFQIVGDKLLPPFNTIDGMGDKAAEAMEIAAKDGPYLSKDDFRQRTKVSKTLVDLMADMGLLGDLPETNQLSLFDFA